MASNAIIYTLDLRDRLSDKLKTIGINNTRQLSVWQNVQRQVLASNRVMRDMGVSIGSLNGRISALRAQREWIPASNREAIRATNNEIRALERQIKKLESLNGGKFKTWTQDAFGQIPFANLIKNPLVIAGTTVVASLKKGMEREKDTTIMETLLGDKKKAEVMIKDILSYAAKTPYSASDIQSASKTMLSFGVNHNKVIPSLKAIGDIAAGDANRMSMLTLAFSQMSSAGKLMGQDLLQMINAGFNPLQEISKKTGKSMTKLRDAMSKGKISSNMVTDAFISATSAGGQFYDMANKIGQTAGGQLSMLKAQFTESLAGIGKVLMPAANGFLKFSNGIISNFSTIKKYTPVLVSLSALVVAHTIIVKKAIIQERLHALTMRLTASAGTNLGNVMKFLKSSMGIWAIVGSAIAGVVTWLVKLNTQKRISANLDGVNKGARDNSRDELVKLKQLYDATQNINLAYNDRIKAAKALKAEYPDIFKGLTTEKILAGDAAVAYNSLVSEIVKKAYVQSIQDKLKDALSEFDDAGDILVENYNNYKKKYNSKRPSDNVGIYFGKIALNSAAADQKVLNASRARYNKAKAVKEKLENKLKGLGINDLMTSLGLNGGTNGGLNTDLTTASEGISSGGKSVKNFNITINGGLIHQVDNNFASTNESPQSASGFMQQLSDALQMVINDVNYSAD
jgi:tape measure domain-containing protein